MRFASWMPEQSSLPRSSLTVSASSLPSAKLPATILTYSLGILSALIFGVGLCLCMNVIGGGTTAMFIFGFNVGCLGLLGMGVNYPLYKKVLAQGKQKYAYEIIALAEEISKK